MNIKVALLLIGLLVGGLAGYLTRPEASELKLGPVSVEIQGNQVARDGGASLTSGQMRHIGLYAAIGAAIGLGFGFVAGRR